MFDKFKKFAKQEWDSAKQDFKALKNGFMSGFWDGYYIGALAALVVLVAAAAMTSVAIPIMIGAGIAGGLAGKAVIKGIKSLKRRRNERTVNKNALVAAPQNASAMKSGLGDASVEKSFTNAVNGNKAEQAPAETNTVAAPELIVLAGLTRNSYHVQEN